MENNQQNVNEVAYLSENEFDYYPAYGLYSKDEFRKYMENLGAKSVSVNLSGVVEGSEGKLEKLIKNGTIRKDELKNSLKLCDSWEIEPYFIRVSYISIPPNCRMMNSTNIKLVTLCGRPNRIKEFKVILQKEISRRKESVRRQVKK